LISSGPARTPGRENSNALSRYTPCRDGAARSPKGRPGRPWYAVRARGRTAARRRVSYRCRSARRIASATRGGYGAITVYEMPFRGSAIQGSTVSRHVA
jgi:hypothetical protein